MILETNRLILRPWEEEDARWLYFYARNHEVGLSGGWPPHKSEEESLFVIQTTFSKPETYAVVYKDRPIGCVNLYLYPDGNYYWGEGNAELGFWVGRPFWGHGMASEACKRLLQHGFDDLNLKTIFAIYRLKNKRSKAVLKKLGFKRHDSIFKYDYKDRPVEEVAMYLNADAFKP